MRQEITLPGKVANKVITLKDFNNQIQLEGGLSKAYPVYRTIVQAMESKYSWLGKQVAEELLDSIASSVIDRCYNFPFRANQHVLLVWDYGWFKSSMLGDFLSMMPAHYFGLIGKITDATLRGSVEKDAKPGSRFAAPQVLQYDFALCREFGAGFTEDAKLKELLLTLLEDQVVSVNLLKFAVLDDLERKGAEVRFARDEFLWETDTSMRYKSKCTFWCANYIPIDDGAMLSRFNIVVPQQILDSKLRNFVMTHPNMKISMSSNLRSSFRDINEAVDAVMGSRRPLLPVAMDLKKALEGIAGVSPRVHSNIIKKLLAAAWWGFWYDDDAVRGMALQQVIAKSDSQTTNDDRIITLLQENWYTTREVSLILGVPISKVRRLLNDLKDRPLQVVRKRDPIDRRKTIMHVMDSSYKNVGGKQPKREVPDGVQK